jgi:hypothetical protein
MLLDTADSIRDHLRTAIESRECWVVVADSKSGHDRLIALARQVYDRRGAEGLDHCKFGRCDFVHLGTWHRTPLSFITIPKSLGSLEITKLLTEEQIDRRDLIMLLEETSADEVQRFLWAAELGRLSPDPLVN